MDMVKKQYDVWMIQLDPALGTEIQKVRPCLVVSPTASNNFLKRSVVVPLTSTLKSLPTRLDCLFQKRQGQLAIDQVRAVDDQRFLQRLGSIDKKTARGTADLLVQFFRYPTE
jgi:mRNA interferase MazF